MEATDFDGKLAGADLVITGEGRIDAQTAFGKTALGVASAAAAAGVPCIAVGGGVTPEGIEALAAARRGRRPGRGAATIDRGGDGRRRRARRALRRTDRPPGVHHGRAMTELKTPARRRPAAKPKPRKRREAGSDRRLARRLDRYRPGLVGFTLDALAGIYGQPEWERRLDPTSELILTILTQNTADMNAEDAFERLRAAYPSGLPPEHHNPGAGWGGGGLPDGAPPDWTRVETAPLEELIEVIRPGGLANQKAPRIQAALRTIREERGDYSLEFLGDMSALEARDWLTGINGIGKKTASVVLLFCFGLPLMPVDRHVERVAQRVGLLPPKVLDDPAHDIFLALLAPERAYEAHVNLIHHGRLVCHARNPAHELCPLRDRCRFVDPKAPCSPVPGRWPGAHGPLLSSGHAERRTGGPATRRRGS